MEKAVLERLNLPLSAPFPFSSSVTRTPTSGDIIYTNLTNTQTLGTLLGMFDEEVGIFPRNKTLYVDVNQLYETNMVPLFDQGFYAKNLDRHS